HRGAAVAWRYAVDGDALARDFTCQRHGETVHARLGSGVVGLAELTGLAVDRGDVDDAAEAPFAHPFDDVAAHVEYAVEVDAQHVDPLLRRHLAQGRVAGDTGGVDEDVDRAVLRLDRFDRLRTLLEVADVDRLEEDLVRVAVDLAAELVDALFA